MDQPANQNVKSAAREAIDALPDNTTWDDVLYRIYVRRKIEEGLADAEAGCFVDEDELLRQLGISL